MYITYEKDDYSDLAEQHNIMVLVGNGFDIAAINRYGCGRMKGKNSSYSNFYDYVTYFKLCDESNAIYRKMTDDRQAGKDNWSDFENTVDELVMLKNADIVMLEKDLEEIQNCFTQFLNEIVTTDVLIEMNKVSRENALAYKSMSQFLGDLDKNNSGISFASKTGHYHLFNYLFVNFNYTSLLDNYIYLDKAQFDPHIHKTVDRNFQFFPNPKGVLENEGQGTTWSSYVITNIIHPHGSQDIPRSMIFGTELQDYDKSKPIKKMVKSYWAQNDIRYKRYFEDTELFIIYGMSLSKTDSWWLDKIYDALAEERAELIIYQYGTEQNEEEVKEKYIDACIRHRDSGEERKQTVKKNIYVILLKDNYNIFLGFPSDNVVE